MTIYSLAMGLSFDPDQAPYGTDTIPEYEASRAGHTWSEVETTLLCHEYMESVPLQNICLGHKRSKTAILAKMAKLKLIISNTDSNYQTTYVRRILPIQNHNPTEKTTMTTKNIETKVLIAGIDAATMSDTDIFSKISKLEGEISKLTAIKAKSVKLAAAISAIEDDVQKLVAYVDGRD